MHVTHTWLIALCIPLLASCAGDAEEQQSTAPPEHTMDHHSHARPEEAVITHLDLDIRVDMDAKRIEGTASYDIKQQGGGRIIFDTDGLEILGVTVDEGAEAEHALGDTTFLGQALEVRIAPEVKRVHIRYRTGPDAKALQWLPAHQTADGRQPFLFTQGQAILTRTWIPVQDSPGIRFTYTAQVQVPAGQLALMSASNPTERHPEGRYTFRMEQPIPAYLIALAVGDLAFKSLGDRSGVYAERSVLEKAAWEFADTEAMLEAAEELYGPYRWERYDILVLPPSFPFGGMENPRLTFATPTIIAGDRSLTALIAHEMAHSWSGNLVTNATWNDFWLNEGFTVYFENRICEAVYGPSFARMNELLGHQDLEGTVARLKEEGRSADTHLRLDLAGRDPDDGMNDIAYEKGYAFLRMIEEQVGRPAFDAFLRGYFDRFAFKSMTTDRFLQHLQGELLEPMQISINVNEWVDGPGIPANVVIPVSDRFVKVEAELARWVAGTAAKELEVKGWTTQEWLHFLRALPGNIPMDRMADLDGSFGFTATGNAEVLAAWLEQSVANDYSPAYERLDEFLTSVGRRKFLVPLYEKLLATEKGRIMALAIYEQARPGYHSVSVRTIDEKLDWKQSAPPVAF
jgi:leukotriene-A4 hydrolase